MYELEEIATIEVGPDRSASRRFIQNYWIARAIFKLIILFEAALWVRCRTGVRIPHRLQSNCDDYLGCVGRVRSAPVSRDGQVIRVTPAR